MFGTSTTGNSGERENRVLMRHGSDERIAVTSALASLLAALTLSPLVEGYTWLFVGAIAVITMMVTGIVARQLLRWWPAVAAAQTVVLLLTLLVLFARSRILEGPGALQLLQELVDAGLQVTREQAPPVEATQGIVLLVAGSTGVVALLVDLMAATLRQPALAGLPLLAVYCVPAALLDGGLPWFYFLVAASGFLLLLTADSGDRVRGWGRVLASSSPGGGRRPADGGMARGGRRVGAVAVLMAVAVPAVVPGLNNQIIGGNGDGDGTGGKGRTITRINPILDLRKDLANPKNTRLLTYRTNVARPAPLRIVTADVFDGKTWSPSTNKIPVSQKAQGTLPAPPGLGDDVQTVASRTEIRIGPLEETYLPLPYPATAVQVRGDWLYDAATLNVIGDGVSTKNLSYQVNHLDVRPTAQQLADAGAAPAALAERYLALPQSLPSVIGDTARKIGGDGSDYDKAVRLQSWFRSGVFTYSLQAPKVRSDASGSDAIVAFLDQKYGYCVHFASTMAVMARTLNIPARVAVGFLPGEKGPGDEMVISANDAHAWPELYFEGVGWVRFEPTPRGSSTTPPSWSTGILPEDPKQEAEPEATRSAAPDAKPTPATPRRVDEAAPSKATTTTGPGVPWRTMLIFLGLVLAAASPRLAAELVTRRRWARATSVPALAEAAWNELRLGLGDVGVSWVAAWSPRAIQRGLMDDYPLGSPAVAALGRLTSEVENGRYAPPNDELGRTAAERQADVDAVLAAVSAPLSGRTRWRARVWPQSGVEALAGLGSGVNSALEQAWRWLSVRAVQAAGRLGVPTGRRDSSAGGSAGAAGGLGRPEADDGRRPEADGLGRPGADGGRDRVSNT